MNWIYKLFKKLKTKNKITFISRQSNRTSIDFSLLAKEIEKEDANIKVWQMEKKVGTELNAYMHYLESLHQEEFILSLRQLQEMYADICRDENVSMKDRLKAMELYGKTIGAFTDNVNVKAEVEQIVFTGDDDVDD